MLQSEMVESESVIVALYRLQKLMKFDNFESVDSHLKIFNEKYFLLRQEFPEPVRLHYDFLGQVKFFQ